jgi:hypothetical protein
VAEKSHIVNAIPPQPFGHAGGLDILGPRQVMRQDFILGREQF